MDWGRRGTQMAAARGDVLVIVDTLSFSTASITAVQHGAAIYPCATTANTAELGQQFQAEVAVHRRDVPTKGRFSLSPLTFLNAEAGTRVILPSPNGATCSYYGRQVPHLFVGTLINAAAVATVVNQILTTSDLAVTVIACGERWKTPHEDGELRFAIEDYLGAGAIISNLNFDKSPEAILCEAAFRQAQPQLEQLIWDCGSGRELRETGYADNVHHSTRLNLYDAVPTLRHGWLVPF